MRLMDDWLFVSADRQKASRFYDMVSTGMHPNRPEFGDVVWILSGI